MKQIKNRKWFNIWNCYIAPYIFMLIIFLLGLAVGILLCR